MVERERTRERRRFVIVNPADSFMERNGINAQRLDDIDAIRRLTTGQPDKETESDTPEFLAVETTREQFLRLAKETLKSPNANVAGKCFESLVLIVPEAETTSDTIDQATGIRIVEIKKGATRFPMHPTPNS